MDYVINYVPIKVYFIRKLDGQLLHYIVDSQKYSGSFLLKFHIEKLVIKVLREFLIKNRNIKAEEIIITVSTYDHKSEEFDIREKSQFNLSDDQVNIILTNRKRERYYNEYWIYVSFWGGLIIIGILGKLFDIEPLYGGIILFLWFGWVCVHTKLVINFDEYKRKNSSDF